MYAGRREQTRQAVPCCFDRVDVLHSHFTATHCNTVCCSVLQLSHCNTVCCSVMQSTHCNTVCCSVLQCVAVCCRQLSSILSCCDLGHILKSKILLWRISPRSIIILCGKLSNELTLENFFPANVAMSPPSSLEKK